MSINKKHTRRWDSERGLSLRRHRTRTTKYNRLVHKFRPCRSTPFCVRTQVYKIQWNNAMQRPLCRSRSFKVTDFGTNRKLIYDFLLVINTNLPHILHRFQVMADYWSNFRYREGSASLTLLLGWSPANIAINDISLKTILCLHFRCRKYWFIFNHFYVIRLENYWTG